METIEDKPPRPVAAPEPVAFPPAHAECDQCGSAMDSNQRYCVVCGAHRRVAHDPAARYLMTTSAKVRGGAGGGSGKDAAAGRSGRRSPTLGLALALALVPVMAAVGVAVGRSGGNDEKLLNALRSQHPQVINTGGSGSADSGGSLKASKIKDTTDLNPANAGKVLNRTSYGAVHQITGYKANPQQLAQGKQIVQKIQQTQGKDYVNAQRGLPDQISVP